MLLVFQLHLKWVQNAGVVWCHADRTLSEWIETALVYMNAPYWLISFMLDGVVNGVGAVVEFIPFIVVLLVVWFWKIVDIWLELRIFGTI